MASPDYEASEDFTLDLVDEVPCPRCDKTLRVPKDHSGKIMCPNCEWKFQFPLPPELDYDYAEAQRRRENNESKYESWKNFFWWLLKDILLTILFLFLFGICSIIWLLWDPLNQF